MISKKSQIYAKALFEIEANQDLLQQLHLYTSIFMQKSNLEFFSSFTIPIKIKKNILKQCLKPAGVMLQNFFFVLLDNKTFHLLSQIVLAYQKLLEDKKQICSGTIYSAQTLSSQQQQEIEAGLKQRFKKSFVFKQKQDKAAIAGLCIETQDFIFNNTMEQQLKQFKMKGF